MSLLLSAGHHQARSYPIAMVWEEHRIVSRRNRKLEIRAAQMTNLAVSAVLSKDHLAQLNEITKKENE